MNFVAQFIKLEEFYTYKKNIFLAATIAFPPLYAAFEQTFSSYLRQDTLYCERLGKASGEMCEWVENLGLEKRLNRLLLFL